MPEDNGVIHVKNPEQSSPKEEQEDPISPADDQDEHLSEESKEEEEVQQ